jgi:membrane protein required for colicin V production
MDINYFDIIVGIIILLLGLKGIINGFFKELFGLLGIVGGIFVASRIGEAVGRLISDALFHFESHSAIGFTGFLITLAAFWAAMIATGMMFKKLSKLSGLGPVDKILGFVVGSGKFFLIGAVIAYALYNINAVRTNLEPMMENSLLFPALVATGSVIMHIDAVETSEDINETVDELNATLGKVSEKASEKAEEALEESAKELIEDVKAHIENNGTKGE